MDALCEGNICIGSCDATDTESCGGNFDCVHYPGGIFNDGSYTCEQPCTSGACPALFDCDDGKYCRYTGVLLTYTPLMPRANEPITFTGSIPANTGSATEFQWDFAVRDGVQMAVGAQTIQSFDAQTVEVSLTVTVAGQPTPRQTITSVIVQ